MLWKMMLETDMVEDGTVAQARSLYGPQPPTNLGRKHEPNEQAGFYDNTKREPKTSTTMPVRRKPARARPKEQ